MANIKKSMVFIDGSNLLKSWEKFCKKSETNQKINYSQLLLKITEGTDLIRGYYYDSTPIPINSKRRKFHDMLRFKEITIVIKELKYKSIKCRHCKKTDFNVPYQRTLSKRS